MQATERVKRITRSDLRKMSAQQYAEALGSPEIAKQIEELLSSA